MTEQQQPTTPSNGWKKACSGTIRPCSDLGALRNQASLKARTVSRLSSPGGTHGGAESRSGGPKASARSGRRSAAGRSSGTAKSPRVSTDRPRVRPRARQSIHATE